MLDRPLRVILPHPFIVSSSLHAGSLLSFFCAFGRLLGVLRPLFTHDASLFSPLRFTANFAELRACELRRIPLPRIRVNKGKRAGTTALAL
jgi:hypothetical protein